MTRGKHLRRCHAAARSKSVDILARLCRRRRAVTDRRGKLTQLLAAAVPRDEYSVADRKLLADRNVSCFIER